MKIIPNTDRIPFSITDLHPIMISPMRAMIDATRATEFLIDGRKYRFFPFEGYRTPVRQMDLKTIAKTTKAGPWESAHQYGLAVDFAAGWVDRDGIVHGWTWTEDAPWKKLREMARSVGLDIPIKWDLGHVEHPLFRKIRALK